MIGRKHDVDNPPSASLLFPFVSLCFVSPPVLFSQGRPATLVEPHPLPPLSGAQNLPIGDAIEPYNL